MSSWIELHRASEEAAIDAAEAARAGRRPEAEALYARAADLESRALGVVEPGKVRTKAITAVSAVALWHKARHYGRALRMAEAALGEPGLPPFAVNDLRALMAAAVRAQSEGEPEAPGSHKLAS